MIDVRDHSYESVSTKEWIVTNGIGGFASGSLCGANTRRYHGLLVASFNPPTERKVIFSKFEETVIVDGESFAISTNQYPGKVHPEGYKLLKSFDRLPVPTWVFSNKHFSLSKSVFMIHGRNATVIEYQNIGKNSIQLNLIPLLVYRDYHHLMHESAQYDFKTEFINGNKIKITPAKEIQPYFLFYETGKFEPDGRWYRNFEYLREAERGLDFTEDAKSIGQIDIELNAGESAFFLVSTDEHLPPGKPSAWKKHEELRLQSLYIETDNSFLNDLIVSGDQFLVWRLSSKSHSVIAGYPWFTDWGRDTMIAMRGLIIETGKKQIAESILLTFLQYLDEGLIPNRFPDSGGEPEYNTMDATLWMFIVLYEYFQKFNDLAFIKRVFPSLQKIIDAHYAGTKYNIHVTKEGLLFGGAKNTQLTWMDAKVGDIVVTPRVGCPVEINALWYNALNIFSVFGNAMNHNHSGINAKIKLTFDAFRKYFINQKGYLNDVIIPNEMTDDTIRPNQIYAISLPFSPLSIEEGKKVLEIIDEHLYTDLGLRSLSKHHPEFKSIYTGNQWQRDHAYHQGTVWSHLWGEYALAFLKIHKYSKTAKDAIRKKSKALEHHFYNDNCIHGISEIFDGGNPKEGKGCVQQAWAVGMMIKALI